jgi:hypothetical protein
MQVRRYVLIIFGVLGFWTQNREVARAGPIRCRTSFSVKCPGQLSIYLQKVPSKLVTSRAAQLLLAFRFMLAVATS